MSEDLYAVLGIMPDADEARSAHDRARRPAGGRAITIEFDSPWGERSGHIDLRTSRVAGPGIERDPFFDEIDRLFASLDYFFRF